MTDLSRRRFLELTGALAATGLLGDILASPQATAAVLGARRQAAADTRTLIVVDLQGGNDALNTLVPANGAYYDARPTLGLSDNEFLTFAGLDYGVHPALASLEPLWNAGQLTAVYGTGLDGPRQDRSHFNAQDAWRTARPGSPPSSGWLGRYLEQTLPEIDLPLRAIALGETTIAAEGETGRPVSVQSVKDFRYDPPRGSQAVVRAMLDMARIPADDLFGDAQAALPFTQDAVDELQGFVARAETVDEVDLDSPEILFTAAQAIIQGDVGVEVLYVTIDGFDTHAVQAPRHDELLRIVADGLGGLFSGLAETGHGDRTAALVISEFGRRVAENGSDGTDHGRGGLSLLIGPPVRESTVIGEPDLVDLVDGDLKVTVDARHLYHDALRWLGASDQVSSQVLDGVWDEYRLLR